MASMSCNLFVENSEEDSWAVLASYISSLLEQQCEGAGATFTAEIEQRLVSGRLPELATHLAQHTLLASHNGDATAVLAVLCSIATKAAPEEGPAIAEALLNVFTHPFTPTDRPDVRLQGIAKVFNMVPDHRLRFKCTMALSDMAKTYPNLADTVRVMVEDKADKWVKEWSLAPADAATLHFAVADLYEATSRASTERRLQAVCRGLEASAAATPPRQPTARDVERIVSVAKAFLSDPSHFKCDLLAIPGVEAAARGNAVLDLLDAVLRGDVAAVTKAAAGPVAAECGGAEALVAKTRLMALLDVAERARGKAVKYSEVAAAAGVPEGEVEAFVVAAVGKGVVDAKLDQVAGTVVVGRWTKRVFAHSDWELIAQSLTEWGKNLRNAAGLIDEAMAAQLPQPLASAPARQ
ncbi:unnamed protein product [Pedinophyceae sp. YPF-701]|nr:unnamed protein product [Pedinophyceae sp. YPF-701]